MKGMKGEKMTFKKMKDLGQGQSASGWWPLDRTPIYRKFPPK